MLDSASQKTLEAARVAGQVVETQCHGVTYSYGKVLGGGEHFWINGHIRATPQTIKDLTPMSTKSWLVAQLLFWNRTEPGANNDEMSRGDMAELLDPEEISHRPLPAADDTHPKNIYDELKEGFISQCLETAANCLGMVDGRNNGAPESQGTVTEEQDKGKEKRKLPWLETPATSSKRRRSQGPSPAPRQNSTAIVDLTVASDPAPGPSKTAPQGRTSASVTTRPVLSKIWEEKMKEVIRFEKRYPRLVEESKTKQLLLARTGHYIVKCDTIEKMYPGVEGKLNMSIHYKDRETLDCGVFDAEFDIGLLNGTMIMGSFRSSIAKYFEMRTKARPAGIKQDPDYIKLRKESRLETQNAAGGDKPYLNIRFRCKEPKPLFLKEKVVFQDRGYIQFNDSTCLSFSGYINLPMVSDQRVKIEGFKISEEPKGWCPSWDDYDSSRLKQGAAWNEP